MYYTMYQTQPVSLTHDRTFPRITLVFALGFAALVAAIASVPAHRPNSETAKKPSSPLSTNTITATGQLEPVNHVIIGSELSGIIKEVHVDKNDHVSKGQPLAKLDTTRLEGQFESSQAAVNSAKAQVALAEATLKETSVKRQSLEELHRVSNGRLPSRLDLDNARAGVERAAADLLKSRAAVATAEAQMKMVQGDLNRAIIRSPIDGIILTRHIAVGQTIVAGNAPTLFVVVGKLEQMVLKVEIPEIEVTHVKENQTATFTVDAMPGRVYHSKVLKISSDAATIDRKVTYATELDVTNADLGLKPGMSATARIAVTRPSAIESAFANSALRS